MDVNRPVKKSGLALWMDRVLEAFDRAGAGFDPEAVHDLRVALRRCRSVADGLIVIDPDPGWRQMKKAGRTLFRSLGALRDVHVMQEWLQRLGSPKDPTTSRLTQHLSTSEMLLRQDASKALANFDRKQWNKWSMILPRRASRLHAGHPIFKHLALERWVQARQLHSLALRNRSKVAFHNLRIGLKKFRYIGENFLPEQHAVWSTDLKQLQDLLGDVHDLDVLWTTALEVSAFPDVERRSRWQEKVAEERQNRIDIYRSKMLGKDSLWQAWRVSLPRDGEIRGLALLRLRRWGAALERDPRHSNQVSKLALQLYDQLPHTWDDSKSTPLDYRGILQTAALLHSVGESVNDKKPYKATYKLINRLAPPLGLTSEDMHMIAFASRYHRGALPHGEQAFSGLNPSQRRTILRLAGILRLAHAFAMVRDGPVRGFRIQQERDYLVITAKGYKWWHPRAESIAAARHLLETVYKRAIIVKPALTANKVIRSRITGSLRKRFVPPA